METGRASRGFLSHDGCRESLCAGSGRVGGRRAGNGRFAATDFTICLPEQIDTCMEKLRTVPDAASVQTVSRCRHHSHAYNQRIIENDYVRFRFGEERRTAHNKQAKPVHFILGNFIGFRLQAALEQESFFPEPSLPIETAPAHALDADGPWDFQLGEAMLEAGMVKLPHLD